MTTDFLRLMERATEQTRRGDLAAATASIQQALAAQAAPDTSPAPAATSGETIDVECRWVDDEPAAPALPGDGVAQEAPPPAAPAAPRAAQQDAFIAGRSGSGTAAREFKLYVPPAAGTMPLPLVVMLHGCTQDPDDFARGTGMNEAGREQGFYVLYPGQSTRANPQRCWNWFKHSHQQRGRGEPAILAGMVREVIAAHAIDPSRVYVAGLSAGGAMAAILGELYPDLFAAVGVHSGLPAGAARDLPSALEAMKKGRTAAARRDGPRVPTIVIHGDADATVHPVNGEHAFAGAAAPDAHRETQSGRGAGARHWTRHVRRDAQGKAVAEHWVVHGAGHAWAGGRAEGSYTDPQGPDATQAMLQFFMLHAQGG